LEKARTQIAKAAERQQNAAGSVETIHLAAELSQFRRTEQEAAKISRFMYLVLGRECAKAGFAPPGSEAEFAEIHRLLRHLA
jgi:hypothetical protein